MSEFRVYDEAELDAIFDHIEHTGSFLELPTLKPKSTRNPRNHSRRGKKNLSAYLIDDTTNMPPRPGSRLDSRSGSATPSRARKRYFHCQ